MRIGLPAALAAVALSCGLSVPANATTFTFDIDHPVVLTAETDYVAYTYMSKLLGPSGTNADFDIRVFYFDTDANEFVQAPPGGGNAITSFREQGGDTRVMTEYDRPAKFRFTFSTASQDKILISDFNGLRYAAHGTAPEVAFSILPEPSTWLFMLSGFGMIGYAMRRRPIVKTTVAYS